MWKRYNRICTIIAIIKLPLLQYCLGACFQLCHKILCMLLAWHLSTTGVTWVSPPSSSECSMHLYISYSRCKMMEHLYTFILKRQNSVLLCFVANHKPYNAISYRIDVYCFSIFQNQD
jgi:hypothetical protein